MTCTKPTQYQNTAITSKVMDKDVNYIKTHTKTKEDKKKEDVTANKTIKIQF